MLQCILPAWGCVQNNSHLKAWGKLFANLQFFLILNAFLLLVLAFLFHDYSLRYVADNSHPSLPFYYLMTAIWGAHEGSFLLWILLLNTWSIFIGFFGKQWPQPLQSLTLSFLGLMSFCFLLFLLLTSDPFLIGDHLIPQDLNPLLQDPGFLIHPPILYFGYVGFSAQFAITMAWLFMKPCSSAQWAALLRPWVMLAWSFLTFGIMLGSIWAYHVLGWGGFWFWDPVENASLLPWLCCTALLHVLIVVEKKQRSVDWAILLSILCFSLSILGTFLVRSGVIVSVHSFAQDPGRGIWLLVLFALMTGLGFLAYLNYKNKFSTPRAITPATPFFAREHFLIWQSLILFTAVTTVLIGTLYPLILISLNLGMLSVGPPYFNQVLYPLVILGLVLMTLSLQSEWSLPILKNKLRASKIALIVSASLAIFLVFLFTHQLQWYTFFNVTLCLWACFCLLAVKNKNYAMFLAHLGFIIFILSISLNSAFVLEKNIRIAVGEQNQIGPYQIQFNELNGIVGKNYKGVSADISLRHQHRTIIHLYPEKRIYTVRDMVMTKIGIYSGIFHDIYIALGEPLNDNEWTMRLYYKPFIRWIWLGGLLMGLGGLLTLGRRKIYGQ